jgi:hypothetical protein
MDMKEGHMKNLELPDEMSACDRMFIASLLDKSMAPATHEIPGLVSAPLITAENDPPCAGEAMRTNAWAPV